VLHAPPISFFSITQVTLPYINQLGINLIVWLTAQWRLCLKQSVSKLKQTNTSGTYCTIHHFPLPLNAVLLGAVAKLRKAYILCP
jgi:hypothetical protein